MAFHIRDEETDRIVRALAQRKGTGLTEAVRTAAANELERLDADTPFMEKVRQIQKEFKALGKPTGLKADKAFYDSLNDE